MKNCIEIINEMQMYKANNDFEGFEAYLNSLSPEELDDLRRFGLALLDMVDVLNRKIAFSVVEKEVNQ